MATPNSEASHYSTLASSQRLCWAMPGCLQIVYLTLLEAVIPGGFPTICVQHFLLSQHRLWQLAHRKGLALWLEKCLVAWSTTGPNFAHRIAKAVLY